MTVFLIMIMFSVKVLAPQESCFYIPEAEKVNPYECIWQAVCKIESNNNCFAYNSHERAYGIAQIKDVRLNDYNIRFKKKVPVIALYDVETSKSIFMAYMSGYNPNDIKGMAICWNGISKENKYYKKLSKQLTKL
jgi:hypothetical protein